jgi:voltage-gated potassium channel
VGYGDFYPVTWEGRLIAALLMVTGVGVFSTLAGAMSTLFLKPAVNHEDQEIRRLSDEVAGLRNSLEKMVRRGDDAETPNA